MAACVEWVLGADVKGQQIARSNVEIVFAEWLDAMRRGDIERMTDALTPDAVHRGIRPEWMCHDRAEIIDMVSGRTGENLPQVDALELIGAGDHVVMSARGPGIGPPVGLDSEEMRDEAHIVITLSEGKIVGFQDYESRAAALLAVEADGRWE